MDTPEKWPGQHRFAALADRHGTAPLARLLNVSNATISHWKVGRRTPSVESLVILAQELKFSLDWLLLGKEEKKDSGDVVLDLDDTKSLQITVNVGKAPDRQSVS